MLKKTIALLMCIILLFTITGCGDFSQMYSSSFVMPGMTRPSSDTTILEDINPEFNDVCESEITTLVFSEDSCEFIFSGTPDEVYNKSINNKNLFNYVRVVSDGKKLTFHLTDKLIIEWKNRAISILNEGIYAATAKEKTSAEVSDDYKSIVYEGIENGFEFSNLFVGCALMQVLNSGDGDSWDLDITFKNYDTKNIVWKGNLPGDVLSVKDSDWIV